MFMPIFFVFQANFAKRKDKMVKKEQFRNIADEMSNKLMAKTNHLGFQFSKMMTVFGSQYIS